MAGLLLTKSLLGTVAVDDPKHGVEKVLDMEAESNDIEELSSSSSIHSNAKKDKLANDHSQTVKNCEYNFFEYLFSCYK